MHFRWSRNSPPLQPSEPIASTTVGCLVGNIVVAIAVGGAIDALISRYWLFGGRTLAGVAALAIFFVGARAWGRRIAALTGDNREQAGRQSALFVALPLIAAAGGLAPLEPVAVRVANGWGLPIHAAYLGLFVPATFVVAALGSFGLGRGLRDNQFGFRLASAAAPAAAVAFLVVASLMYAIGWRIGEPDAGRRATMLVVSAISVTAAALAAGGAIGRKLEKRPRLDGEYHLLSFDQTVEASAFLAAFSRFLTSPAGTVIVPLDEPIEVWTTARTDGAQFFLSDGAYRVAEAAFSPVPSTRMVRGKDVPRGAALMLTSITARAMGVEEMSQRVQQSSLG
jgi:hypothetical protein